MQDLGNNNSDISIYGQWQWQSNEDPWVKGQKVEWTSYSPEQNDLIERAYYEQKNEVDLGDYIISTKHMIQKKKGSVVSQRPIRRISVDEDEYEEICRKERYFDTELPKTVNNLFGSLEDMIIFICARNEESSEFRPLLTKVMERNDLNELNEKIASKIIDCIQTESTHVQRVTLPRQLKELKKLFEERFTSIEHFFHHIMRAYTMPTFLYHNLNKYLRNEDWIALDTLLPYAVCLYFGIQVLQYEAKMDELVKRNSNDSKSMILYRGTRLNKDALDLYTLKKFTNFSWYSVTSTTTNTKVAETFMGMDQKDEKFPVLFKIQVPVLDSKNNMYLNVKPFSKLKKEDEVILAPGCIFKIESSAINYEGFSEISLTLIENLDHFIHKGLRMTGKMSIVARKVCFEYLKGMNLLEHLRHFAGNQIIREIEFKDCEFTEESFIKLVTKIFPTMPHLQKLTFNLCSIGFISGIIENEVPLSRIQQIIIIEKNDFYKTLRMVNTERLSFWSSLASLTLNLSNKTKPKETKMTDQDLSNLCSQTLQNLAQLTSFDLIFAQLSEITDEGLETLFTEGLWHLPRLKSLRLNMNGARKITDKAISWIYSQGLPHLTELEFLDLNFLFCKQITGQVKNQNSPERESLPKLTSLGLYFSGCSQVTDQKLALCSQIFSNPTQFRFLKNLRLKLFEKLTDEGLKILHSQVFQHLSDLRSLDLDFSDSSMITDKGVSFLYSNGIEPLKNLDKLSIDLNGSFKIKKQESERLRDLFAKHPKYSDFEIIFNEKYNKEDSEDFEDFEGSEDLKDLEDSGTIDSVEIVKWNFERTIESAREGEEESDDDGPNPPKIKFTREKSITPEAISQEFDQLYLGHPELKKLGFIIESRYSDDGEAILIDDVIEYIVSSQLKRFTKVKHLYLNFKKSQITDNSVKFLAEGLENFPKLLSLNMNFKDCPRITDESIKYLVKRGFGKIPQLQDLNLKFNESFVTDEGLKILSYEGIEQLTKLRCLKLNFSYCLNFHCLYQYPQHIEGLGFKLNEGSEYEEIFDAEDAERDEKV